MLFGWNKINNAPINPFLFLNAVQLDGVNDEYRANNSTALQKIGAAAPYSVNIWMKRTADQATGTRILWAKRGTPGPGIFVNVDGGTGYRPRLQLANAAGTTLLNLLATTVTALNTWYMVTVTRDNSGVFRIYVDAVLENTSVAFANDLQNTAQLELGCWQSNATRYFAGQFDEFTAFDKQLSAAEIKWLYNARLGNQPNPSMVPNLLVRYDFDTLATAAYPNPTIADQSGNGHTLTGQNIASNPLVTH